MRRAHSGAAGVVVLMLGEDGADGDTDDGEAEDDGEADRDEDGDAAEEEQRHAGLRPYAGDAHDEEEDDDVHCSDNRTQETTNLGVVAPCPWRMQRGIAARRAELG